MKPTKKVKDPQNMRKIWEFDLYIAGQTPETLTTLSNLKNMCEKHIKGSYKINIIDLLKTPQIAKEMQIFAIPTIIKKIPKPMQRAVGDFSHSIEIMSKFGNDEMD